LRIIYDFSSGFNYVTFNIEVNNTYNVRLNSKKIVFLRLENKKIIVWIFIIFYVYITWMDIRL